MRMPEYSSMILWLKPGLRLKRWLILSALALGLSSRGFGLVLADLYRREPFPEFVYYLTLQFIPRLVRGVLLFVLGAGLGVLAAYQFARSLLGAVVPGPTGPVIQSAIERRSLQSGPKVVAIGGGTGLSTLLRGLKELTANITAIVTVADDGGSSGRLRRDLGVHPPGDFRQCLVALADAEPLMSRLLQHRFAGVGELQGHSFGNLFITAMSELSGGFDLALEECSRVLALRGRVVPSTLDHVTLCAELEDGRQVRGESTVGHSGAPIRRVYLDPPSPTAFPDAVRAILEADTIIIGPGSLFTSVLPNLLVPDIARALRDTPARKVFVCNVATERGETTGYGVLSFVRTLEAHVGSGAVDCVLANGNLSLRAPIGDRTIGREVELVAPDPIDSTSESPRVICADIVDEADPRRHDSRKLAAALAQMALP
jgi:uncharacterized cofD-like protein